MADHSERTAKLVAAFVTFGCLCFFALVGRPAKQPSPKNYTLPAATPQPSLEPLPAFIDPNEEFLAAPGRWGSIDFKNHHYGAFKFLNGKKHRITLKDGEYQYDFADGDRGWISLYAVYYVDVTGDSIPDAIVDLINVGCGVSCDGGAHLLLIYSITAKGELKKRFEYETGSYAYGCGLKSVTMETKKVSLELFGYCPQSGMENPSGQGKFLAINLTRIAFRLSRASFVRTKFEYLVTGAKDVNGYQAEIFINPDP